MARETICGIYKIQNKINNMIYIGQSIDILYRFKAHKKSYDNLAIHKAMQEYGIENFTFEIVEECSREKLDEREKYWISYYDSYRNGYNRTSGGSGTPLNKTKKVLQYDVEGNFIQSFNSEKEAADFLDTDPRYISNCCLHKANTLMNYQFCFEGDENSIQKNPKQNPGADKIPVSKYSLDGIFICNYDSIREAAKENGNDVKGISECCRKLAFSCQGFLWTYFGDPAPSPYNSRKAHSTTSRKVDQYDLEGNYLKTFDTCKEASEAVGLTSGTCIVRACSGKLKTAKGYIWKYHDEEK